MPVFKTIHNCTVNTWFYDNHLWWEPRLTLSFSGTHLILADFLKLFAVAYFYSQLKGLKELYLCLFSQDCSNERTDRGLLTSADVEHVEVFSNPRTRICKGSVWSSYGAFLLSITPFKESKMLIWPLWPRSLNAPTEKNIQTHERKKLLCGQNPACIWSVTVGVLDQSTGESFYAG